MSSAKAKVFVNIVTICGITVWETRAYTIQYNTIQSTIQYNTIQNTIQYNTIYNKIQDSQLYIAQKDVFAGIIHKKLTIQDTAVWGLSGLFRK